MEDITFLTVNFRSGNLIALNRLHTQKLNSSSGKWLIVENTPEEDYDLASLKNESDVRIIAGSHLPITPSFASGSYHHSAALNLGMRYVDTEFVLVIDPDFFMVRSNWIRDVIQHMRSEGLSFFGVPWAPKMWKKFRDFPCIHCMFINLKKVDKSTLDFTPQLGCISPRSYSVWSKFVQLSNDGRFLKAWSFFVCNIPRLLVEEIHMLRDLESARDTGVLLSDKYKKNTEHRSEVVAPVFPVNPYAVHPKGPSKYFHFGKTLLKKKIVDYESCVMVESEYGNYSPSQFGYDEFAWCSKLFGFHAKGGSRVGTVEFAHRIQALLK